jgi:hypothetical protein
MPQIAIWRIRIACWTPKSTDTHSEYGIIVAFPLQEWLHQHASMLRTLPFLFLVHLVKPFLLQGV